MASLQRAQIAHHESGHAVIGRKVGLRTGGVKIGLLGGSGSVKLGDFDPAKAFAELVFFHAGFHAEVRFLIEQGYGKSKAASEARSHAGHDMKQVASVVRWMRTHHGKSLSASSADSKAARLVTANWSAICSMANRHGGRSR